MVFSAQAEVFPACSPLRHFDLCFLRASGGVSRQRERIPDPEKFSPRKRRCFCRRAIQARSADVFSAQAEVFPLLKS